MAQRSHVTIQNIAECAAVSKATVSRYLNGKYEYMSEETRRRIEQVIAETGYRPNKMAGSLKTARSDLIGLVLANPMANLTPFLVGSICDSLTLNGQKMIVVTTHGDPERERIQVQELVDQQVDGLIVTSGDNFDFYAKLDAERLPVVLADRVPANSTLDWAAVNHYAGSAEVVNYFIDCGYRNIVTVLRANRSNRGTIAIREQSAADTCFYRFGDMDHCRSVLIEESAAGTYRNDEVLDCLRTCHRMSMKEPTAVFVADGILMGRLMCALSRLGIDISERFTIGGYDLWDFGSVLAGQICTIEQPLERMGTLAASLLLNRLRAKGERGEPEHILLDCRIMRPESEGTLDMA